MRGSWALLLVLGCTTGVTGDPVLRVVEPAQCPEGGTVELTVRGDRLFPSVVSDFRDPGRSEIDAAFTVTLVERTAAIAPRALEGVTFVEAGVVRAQVPGDLPRGIYHVVVRTPAGAEATLQDGFRVVTAAEAVTRFVIEPVGAQRSGVPFTLIVSAVDATGRVVDGFAGMVDLIANEGSLDRTTLGPFALGRFRGQVTLAGRSQGAVLRVADPAGREGSTAPFVLGSGLGVQLALAPASLALTAGVCSPAVTVSLRDVLGAAAEAESAVSLRLGTGAEGLEVYSDPACTARLSPLLSSGAGSVDLHLRVTEAAAAAELRVSSDTIAGARIPVAVSAAAPVKLAFASLSKRTAIGACAGPFVLRAEDSFGNAAAAAADVSVTLAGEPVGLASIFVDSACATAASTAVLPAGGEARFFVRADAPSEEGRLSAAGQGTGWTAAQQRLEVTP